MRWSEGCKFGGRFAQESFVFVLAGPTALDEEGVASIGLRAFDCGRLRHNVEEHVNRSVCLILRCCVAGAPRISSQDVPRARDGERDEAVCFFLDTPLALRLIEIVVFATTLVATPCLGHQSIRFSAPCFRFSSMFIRLVFEQSECASWYRQRNTRDRGSHGISSVPSDAFRSSRDERKQAHRKHLNHWVQQTLST